MEVIANSQKFIVDAGLLISIRGSKLEQVTLQIMTQASMNSAPALLHINCEPRIFDYILYYLRSQRKDLPSRMDEFDKEDLEEAIKYWTLDRGLQCYDTLTNTKEVN